MANKSYAELLRDPQWQRKRLEVLQRDDWQCVECKARDKTLDVHHKRYPRWGLAPWEVDDEWLVTLCQPCHGQVTALRQLARSLLDAIEIRTGALSQIVGYMQAIAAMHPDEEQQIKVENTAHAMGISDAVGVNPGVPYQLVDVDGYVDIDDLMAAAAARSTREEFAYNLERAS